MKSTIPTKFAKSFVALLLVLCSFFCMTACNRKKQDDSNSTGGTIEEEVNTSKTQLYVSNFNGGYGDAWLYAVKARFEEAHKDDVYETGKKGVQILIDNAKVGGAGIQSSIASSRNQVFFTEGVYYYDFVTQGLVLDLTDMVNEKLTEYGESRSILDKFTDEQKKFLTYNDKIYMIPHFEGYNGITIDVDLFDEKKLFLGSDNQFNYTSESANLSKGPDDKAGTYDDGLPATYDEFYKLCETMRKRGVTPMTWSGEFKWYVNNCMSAMAVDSNGYDESVIGFNFEGTSKKYVNTINDDGTYTLSDKEITNANGYDVIHTEGYYNALQFFQHIIENGWYSKTAYTDGVSHTDTQDDFLLSNKEMRAAEKIAMLVEGCWWESEATDTFTSMARSYNKAGKMDRRFRFIPFPKANKDKVGEGVTLLENNSAYGFINANITEPYKTLALDFLQFCNTDESIVEFNTITNTPKALIYDVSEEDLAKCSYYGRSILELKNAENTKVVYPISDNPLFYENNSTLQMRYRFEYGLYLYPVVPFKNENMSAKTYFEGLTNKFKTGWATTYSKYIDQ